MDSTLFDLLTTVSGQLKEHGDFLIVGRKDTNNGAAVVGDVDEAAKGLFNSLVSSDKEIPSQLYRLIKMVVWNIINNNTPFTMDLLNMVLSFVEEKDGGEDE